MILDFKISLATLDDIPEMVALSYQKRCAYEKVQPQFWCYAQGAEEIQFNWFKELLDFKDYFLLVARSQGSLSGFIIGQIIESPAVYNPGGTTLKVDDFRVACLSYWYSVGGALLKKLRQEAKINGAAQLLIVCGSHDLFKEEFLKSYHLNIASKWYVGGI